MKDGRKPPLLNSSDDNYSYSLYITQDRQDAVGAARTLAAGLGKQRQCIFHHYLEHFPVEVS